MGINDAEFIVHARSDLPAALEALEEAELRGVTFEQWFRAAVKHHNDLTTERDGYKAQAEVRGEALDKMGCSYNLRYPCITALKDYPSSWCQRCIALAATPGRTREEEKERR